MTVLLLGEHQELSLYRVQALEAEGFRVISPASRNAALRAIKERQYDAAVLSYTLSNDTAQELAELVRESCPTCPLIAITESPWADTKIQPDDSVVGKEGPQALVEALRRASRQGLRRIK